jgi:hypothetical protein
MWRSAASAGGYRVITYPVCIRPHHCGMIVSPLIQRPTAVPFPWKNSIKRNSDILYDACAPQIIHPSRHPRHDNVVIVQNLP